MRCLLLTFDCLPRRWLGCYGSLDSTTRGFDRLAAAGTTFDNAISTDVRANAASIAGFEGRPIDDGVQIHAAGRPLSLATSLHAAEEEPASRPRGRRRRAESRLSHDLHQATSWMREQPGPSLAWVRHRGLRPVGGPVDSQEDASQLLEQQGLIDEEIDTFLDEWLDCADERWTFILTASRGVLRSSSTTRRRNAAAPLISDDLARVPLLVLEGRGEGFGRRWLGLLPTTMLAAVISDPQSSSLTMHERLLGHEPARFVTIQGDDGALAVRTAGWLFVRSSDPDREEGEGFLYRKPQDVCDVFDVRSIHSDEAIRLDTLIGS